MSWIKFDEKYPEKFPVKGRNYDLHVEDIITGIDENNKAFDYACFCKSLPDGMSMPFTHWMELDAI
jgi:hypothetical protein